MITSIIFTFALYFSVVVLFKFINSMFLIIRSGKVRSDSKYDMPIHVVTCILWGVFYYLTN